MTLKNKSLRFAFLTALCILLLLSIVSYTRLNSLIVSGQWVNHTTQVTLELEKMIGSLRGAEAAHRGYLLTHDKRFLEGFYQRLKESPAHIQTLKRLTNDNPDQQKNLQAVEELVRQRREYMFKMLAIDKSHTPSAAEMLNGMSIMDSLRMKVTKIVATENDLLQQRERSLQRQKMLAPAMILIFSVISFLILIISYLQLNKSLLHAQRLEEAVMKQKMELEKKNEFSETIINTTPDLIAVYDPEMRIIGFNKANEDLFKMRREDVLGKVYLDIFPASRDSQAQKDLVRALGGEVIHNSSFRSSVTGRYYENFITPLLDQEGKVYAAVVIAHDITGIIETTEKINAANISLQERNQFVETLINSSPDLIMVVDRDLRFITINKKAENIINSVYKGNVIGQKLTDINPDAKKSDQYFNVLKAFEGEIILSGKVKARTSNDYYEHSYIPLKNINNEVYAVMVISHNITSQVESEQLLMQSEEKFNKLFQLSPFSISLSEIPSGKFVEVNENFLKTFGFSPDEVIGRSSLELGMIDPGERQKILNALSEMGAVKNVEIEVNRKSGEKIPVLVSIETISIGRQKYFLNAINDIIERKKAEEEIAQTNRRLQQMNEELNSFAYISSHDLQEPLRKIQWYATRIMEKEGNALSEDTRDYFKKMERAAERMQQLINDLLSYSHTSTAEKKFTKTNLGYMLTEIKEELKETITSTNADIQFGILPDMEVIPFQFKQLFTNLISNAIKFTRPGISPCIKITGQVTEQVKANGLTDPIAKKYHQITITDNGIGFDPQYSEQIFGVFTRLHGRSEYEGTGIGLSIVKRIVDNHNGIIHASSEPGEGATFNIYIPAS